MTKIIVVAICSLLFVGCVRDPNFSDIPEITFLGLSKNAMDQNSFNTDSLYLQFKFTDGNGDFGNPANESVQNIVIKDNRTGLNYDQFRAPTIPEEGASKGVEGEITIRLYTTCCLFPENIPPCSSPPKYPTDTLTLDIYIMDREQNKSNVITTEYIILKCN